uniref:Uncharacterized protein n=1 Tax=Mycena chlorophos TaxID=658473 RepID=A0ABQ0LN57_MYCCL|nr:predicted protein [Mycena chlorophos]
MFPLLLAAFASLHGALALLTPTGRTPSGKDIYTVPPGSRIAAYSASQIEVLAPNGTLLHTFSNTNSPSPSPSKREDYNDHFAQAYYDCGVDPLTGNTTQILTLNTTFVVPPIPENYESQFFFFGPSIEGFDPVTNVSVGLYQAALQYGASLQQGGPFWTLYATFESSTFYIIPGPAASSSPTPRQEGLPVNIVYPGDVITAALVYDPDGPMIAGQLDRVWYQAVYSGPATTGYEPLVVEVSFDFDPPARVRAQILLQEEGAWC